MNNRLNAKILLVTLATTAVFYLIYGQLVARAPSLLTSLADPAWPVLSKLLLPIWRAGVELFFIVGLALVISLVYRVLSKTVWFRSRRISPNRADRGQVLRETLLNANLALAGGLQGTAYIILTELGHSKIYPSIDERGWAYAILSLLVYAAMGDAWFYFWHRVYHKSDLVYRNVHSLHHLSVVTTPMTSSQVAPLELLPSTLFGLVFVATVPMAMPIISFLVLFLTVYLMVLHAGYEIFPRGMSEHWLGKWLVTPTYHQMHHELGDKHMGLYFTWWDRLFGTYSSAYRERFGQVTAPRAAF